MQLDVFDPYRAELRLLWRNRLDRLRAELGQTALHAFFIAALLVLLALPLLRALDDLGPIAREALTRWPTLLASVALVAMTLRHTRQLVALRARQRSEWLASQPVAERMQIRRRRDRVRADLLLHAMSGTALLALVGADAATLVRFLALALVAALISLPISHRLTSRRRTPALLGSRLRDSGVGRLWRWQRIETAVALRGRRLGLGVWALLLVPMGSGPGTTLAVGVAGLALAALFTAWNRSLGVLSQAQAWLGAQPLSGWRLLRASSAVPMLVLFGSAGLFAVVLLLLGTPGVAAIAGCGLVSIGSLQFACAAVDRGSSRRIPLRFLFHLALLLAVLQSIPLFTPLCWLLQLFVLLRQAARP